MLLYHKAKIKKGDKVLKESILSGYYVSDTGDVFSTRNSGRENVTIDGVRLYKMKGVIDRKGYKKYYINKRSYFAHRLVALAFIPNPRGLPIINHKDKNPLNNNVSNLEWCTYSYNTRYAYADGYRMKCKEVDVYLHDVLVQKCNNITEAAEFVIKHGQFTASIRNVTRRMCYGDYKLVVPSNGDTLEYNHTANREYSSKTLTECCSLYTFRGELLETFSSKNDAIQYCKDKYGTSDGLRRNNCIPSKQVFLLLDGDESEPNEVARRLLERGVSRKGGTHKKKGFLYHGDEFVGEFSSINKASLFCRDEYGEKLNSSPPYKNISKRLLFSTTELTREQLLLFWKDTEEKGKYRCKSGRKFNDYPAREYT